MLQKSLRAVGIRCWSACEFWSGLGMGSGPRSDDAPEKRSALSAPPRIEVNL